MNFKNGNMKYYEFKPKVKEEEVKEKHPPKTYLDYLNESEYSERTKKYAKQIFISHFRS